MCAENPRLLILAGAGTGSAISTEALTTDLVQWRGILEPSHLWLRSIRRRLFSRGPGPEWLFMHFMRVESKLEQGERLRPFFEWLIEVSKDVYPTDAGQGHGYRPPVGKTNFEELIHIVERLTYLLSEPYYDSLYKRPPPYEAPFFKLTRNGNLLKKNGPISLYDIIVMASTFILDTVARLAEAEPSLAAREFIDTVRSGFCAKLFSLNYDSRIVRADEDWWTGFRPLDEAEAQMRDTKPGVQVFEPEASIPADAQAFVQMHGSTHFGWIAHYRAPRYVICRYARPQLKRGTPRREGFEMWNDRTALPTLPIITGFRKSEKTLVEPYASYFHYFRDEAFRTPDWLILGYGGGDPHINAVLTSAADHWGGRLRAFVSTYVPECENRSSDAFRAEVEKRVSFLGRAGYRTLSPDVSSMDGELVISDRLHLTLDGEYLKHASSAIEFLTGLRRCGEA